MKNKERRFIISFIIPPLLVYVIFFIYPFLNSFRISFFKWSGYTKHMQFIGFDNFKQMFGDSVILKSLLHNGYFIVASSVLIFVLAMFFAVVFTSKKYPENGFYRVLFFFPNMLSIIIVAIIWMFVFNPSFGLIRGVALFGSEKTVLHALLVPQVWMQVGFYMVLFIASINTIPKSLYEAAELDGATGIKQFIHITLPNIWYTIQISIVFFIINSINNTFALISITTKGGPNRSSEVLTTYFYEQAFVNSNFGYGTAIAMSLFILMFVISLTIMRFTRRDV